MPSPAGLFKDLFTVAELQAMLKELATTGMISSLSGGAKSGSYQRLSPEQQGIELRAELKRLGGIPTVNRIEQHLFRQGVPNGNITTPQ